MMNRTSSKRALALLDRNNPHKNRLNKSDLHHLSENFAEFMKEGEATLVAKQPEIPSYAIK